MPRADDHATRVGPTQLSDAAFYAGPMTADASTAGGRRGTTPAARRPATPTARRPAKSTAAVPAESGPTKATKTVDIHLVDKLVVEIQGRISDGDIPIGSWLRQERLAQELGVSRMPIREALRQLQAVGAVEIIANRGARVRLPSTLDVIEVYAVRGLLEGNAGAAAAQLITSDQIERLQAANEKFKQIINDLESKKRGAEKAAQARWREATSQFQAVIIEACGNRTLAEVVEGLHRKIPRNLAWLGLGGDLRRLKRNAAEHQQILDAINNGDSERARELLTARADHASELLVRTLNEVSTTSVLDAP